MVTFDKVARYEDHYLKVSELDKEVSFNFLESVMPSIMKDLTSFDRKDSIEKWICSADQEKQGAAFLLAAHQTLSPYDFNSECITESVLLSRLTELSQDADNSTGMYVTYLERNKELRAELECPLTEKFFETLKPELSQEEKQMISIMADTMRINI